MQKGGNLVDTTETNNNIELEQATDVNENDVSTAADQPANPSESQTNEAAPDNTPPEQAPAAEEPPAVTPGQQVAMLEQTVQTYRSRLVTGLATAAAVRIGVNPDRVDPLIRLTDLSDINVDAEDSTQAIEAAIRATLQTVPEFAAAQGTGSAFSHRRPPAGASGMSIAQMVEQAMGVK